MKFYTLAIQIGAFKAKIMLAKEAFRFCQSFDIDGLDLLKEFYAILLN